MIATQAEMDSVNMHPKNRDYCAHKYIELKACLKNTMPFYWNCWGKRHEYSDCLFDDLVLRMKEWERERRLNERAKKKELYK